MLENVEGITRNDIKQNNLLRVFHLLRSNADEELSKQDIAAQLGLSLPTVSKNISILEAQSLICSGESKKSTGGRNSCLYRLNANLHVAVGVNITKHHISAVVINLRGEIVSRLRIRHLFSRDDAYYQKIGEIVRTVVDQAAVASEQILGVALVMPALISKDGQSTYYNGVLHQDPVIHCSEFAKYIPWPSRFTHDGKAAAYAESWFNHDVTDFFYLMISDSIIGTPLLAGRPYVGQQGRSGEIGHVRMKKNGHRCYCGKRGCMETYCSTKVLSQITDGNLAAFFEKLQNNDPEAVSLWDKYIRDLVVAINDVRMLFDCSIVIGGYLGEFIDPYMDQLYALAEKEDPFCNQIDYISVCKHKTEASATGGALMYLDEFVQTIA